MEYEEGVKLGFFTGIILMACFHGILLASIFVFNKKLNTKSNRFLALSIFGICVILFYEFIFWLELEEQLPLWFQYLPIYIRTTIPVGLFYFVVFLIQPEHQLSKFEKLGFVAIGIELLLDLLYFPVNLFLQDDLKIEIAEDYIVIAGWFLSVITAVVFLPLAFQKVNRYQQFLYNNYSTTERKSLRWLQVFLTMVLGITVLWVISFFQYILDYEEACELTFGIVTLCLIILLFWIGYFMIIQYSWFEIAPIKNELVTSKEAKQKLSSNTINYYKQLKQLLQEEKIYEDINLTLDMLSERLQISSGYLSQIIKENEQKNFFQFINHYRIEAVKEKLLNEEYANYTIMGIALESGFNSKSTFNAVFKKFTGETPSTFKRRHTLGKVQVS